MTNPYGLDTLGLWEATVGLPEQLEAAAARSTEILASTRLPGAGAPDAPGDPGELGAVVVLGMGASGLAGDATAAVGATVPVVVSRDYEVPRFVGPHTLVFAVSWSGDTEETCAATAAALERGASVVVVTGGGALGELARASDLPLFPLPPGLPASRTAWGAAVVPLLLTLSQLGLVPPVSSSLTNATTALARRRDALVVPKGPAEDVARRIGRTMPLIHGSAGVTAVAAQRWKTQINANAKTPAFTAVEPDLSHNEVAGWGQHGDVTRQVFTLVTLRHAGEHPQVARRMALVDDVIDEVVADSIAVWAQGDDDLARLFDLVLFGDLVSLHLAGREGTDPGPAPAVDGIRTALR